MQNISLGSLRQCVSLSINAFDYNDLYCLQRTLKTHSKLLRVECACVRVCVVLEVNELIKSGVK